MELKFNSYQEMYAMLQSYHGTKRIKEGFDFDAMLYQLEAMPKSETFGSIFIDYYQCGDGDMFCTEFNHENDVDGKTHVFYYFTDFSDTVEDDEVFDTIEESVMSTIDFGFIQNVMEMNDKN